MTADTTLLGIHTVTTQDDHSITIESEAIALTLDSDEAYRLFLLLQELFK